VSAAAFLALGGVMALVAQGTPATATTNPNADVTGTTPSTRLVDPFAPLAGQWGAQPDAGSAGPSHTATHGS
jgi:hypothetical protein